jgi:hypothetical protein
MYCGGPDRKAVIYKFVGNAPIKSLHEQASSFRYLQWIWLKGVGMASWAIK